MIRRPGIFKRGVSVLVMGSGFLIAAVVFSIVSAFGQKPDSDADREDKADKAAFQNVCGGCHPSSMVNSLKSEPDWLETVQVMAKLGAKGTDEQFERLFRFLLRNWTKVNVNKATAEEIAPVLDISDATAEAIVARRTAAGAFKTLEELKKIPGVNAEKLEARKDRVAF
jgi:competence protein ComEA